MKYMILLSGTKAMADWYLTWKPEDFAAQAAYMEQLHADMAAAGQLVDAHGLAFPHEALSVTADASGLPLVDGVFPESKEFLMGYTMIDVETHEQAIAIAARFSQAPGPGGKPSNMPVELRKVMSQGPGAE